MFAKPKAVLLSGLCLLSASPMASAKDIYCQDTKSVEDAGMKASIEGNVAYLVEVTLVGERLLSNMNCTSTGSLPDPDRQTVLKNCTDGVADSGYTLTLKQSPFEGLTADVFAKSSTGQSLVLTLKCE